MKVLREFNGRTLRIALQNCAAIILIAAFLWLSPELGPIPFLKTAQLSCASSDPAIVLESMEACRSHPNYKPGCACGPLANPWFKAYQWGFVPLMAALIAFALLRGRTLTQMLLLNGTITLVLIGMLIVGIRQHDSRVMLVSLMPIIIAVVCGTISGWYLLLKYLHRKLQGSRE